MGDIEFPFFNINNTSDLILNLLDKDNFVIKRVFLVPSRKSK